MSGTEVEMINVDHPVGVAAEEGGGATIATDAANRNIHRQLNWWKVITAIALLNAIIFAILFGIWAARPPPTLTIDPFDPSPAVSGQWQTIVPKDNGPTTVYELGMQSVHAILLPSGRVLIAPGSSWRNFQNITEFFPETDKPEVNKGLFNREEDPFLNSKKKAYYDTVNNAGVYDPSTNEFFRVPHPVPVDDVDNPGHFIPSDLFCSGQLQLPDDNPLFMGGTQYYFPFRTGHNAAYIYDWIRDINTDWAEYDWTVMPNQADPSQTPWTFAGLMENARWYPSAIPLMDGRLVIVSDFVGFKNILPGSKKDMYEFEINTGVNFFDYRLFDSTNTSKAWSYRDVKTVQNSPFSTPLLREDWTDAATNCDGENGKRRCEAYRFDAFKLYPRAYLLPDGERIFFTRDGDYNSLRTRTGEYMRNTKKTYIMNVGSPPENKISFEHGPDLPRYALSSGTVVRNPMNPTQLLISGGLPNYGGNLGPSLLEASDDRCDINNPAFDVNLANHYLGSRGSRGLLAYDMPSEISGIGSWKPFNRTFLRITSEGDRTMHYMIILPTKDLLVLGGGNYDFSHGVRYPILYAPNANDPSTYASRAVSDTYHDRLYHNTALLLGDGRIFMAGGNANRASVTEAPITRDRRPSEGQTGQKKFNLDHVQRAIYFFGDGYMGKGPKPAPAEDWTGEIYSPPYLFIDGNRRAVIEDLSPQSSTNFQFKTILKGKSYYLFKSNLTIEMQLSGLPQDCTIKGGKSFLVFMKLAASTHGWDSGQQLFEIPFLEFGDSSIVFDTPDSSEMQIIPGFYHLFYIDCKGKPTVAATVRFDDNVDSIDGKARPS